MGDLWPNVRDTVLDSTEVIYESAYGLSIGIIKIDLG